MLDRNGVNVAVTSSVKNTDIWTKHRYCTHIRRCNISFRCSAPTIKWTVKDRVLLEEMDDGDPFAPVAGRRPVTSCMCRGMISRQSFYMALWLSIPVSLVQTFAVAAAIAVATKELLESLHRHWDIASLTNELPREHPVSRVRLPFLVLLLLLLHCHSLVAWWLIARPTRIPAWRWAKHVGNFWVRRLFLGAQLVDD